LREPGSGVDSGLALCSARKLLTDAAPVPVMAANHKLARLRRKKKRLRAKYKKLQRRNRHLDKMKARWIHDARQEGVARVRAEDQLDDERSEYRTYREQTHRHMLAISGAARTDPAPAIAANDEVTRLRAEVEELRAKHDDLEEEKEELRGAVHSLDKRNMRLTHTARQDRVARLRAEDQLLDERCEYRAYREQTHQHELARMGAARPDPSPSSSSEDSSSSSSSSSDGPSRKHRRRRSRSRSMSPASRHEAKARAICNKAADDYFDEIRTSHAKHKATTALARERRDAELRDAELQRALEGIEYCHICRASPCRCNGGRGHHRGPEANRDLAVETARVRAEAEALEAVLQKQRAADALSDYLASRPKRARVAEIEDAAELD
jgi:FtsZ-binding cell division protein ZapB